jgi:hypothetical protein
MRGTAILARHDFPLTNVTTLPTGRAIAADYNGLRLVNVYAPAGTAKRTDRELFFNSKLPASFYAASESVLLGGDFNCVLHPTDTTRPLHYQPCFVRGCPRFSAFRRLEPGPPASRLHALFTHRCHKNGPLLYHTRLLLRKTGIEILPAAFIDHKAVVLRLSSPTVRTGWRRGRWKMDPVLVTDAAVTDKIRCAWAKWQRSKHYFPMN